MRQVFDNGGKEIDTVRFAVENHDAFPPANLVFNDVGSSFPGMLMFGLPFFLGREVYIGVANLSGRYSSESLGSETQPLWSSYAPHLVRDLVRFRQSHHGHTMTRFCEIRKA